MENVQLQESSPTFDKDGGQGRNNRDEDQTERQGVRQKPCVVRGNLLNADWSSWI